LFAAALFCRKALIFADKIAVILPAVPQPDDSAEGVAGTSPYPSHGLDAPINSPWRVFNVPAVRCKHAAFDMECIA